MADISTIVDEFTGSSGLWTVGGTVNVANDYANIQSDAANWSTLNDYLFRSGDSFPQGSEFRIKFGPKPAAGFASFRIYSPGVTGVQVEQTATGYRVFGFYSSTQYSVSTFTTDHAWWKVVHNASTPAQFDLYSSADGNTWTFRVSKSASNGPGVFAPTNVYLALHAWGGTTNDYAKFDSVNGTAVVPPTVINAVVATASVSAAAPTLRLRITSPPAAALVEAQAPEVLIPQHVMLDPPVVTAAATAIAPTDVIAPAPNQVAVVAARVTASAPAPTVQERPNTQVQAVPATSRIDMLPPGEYVRISAAPVLTTAIGLAPRRVGPALSDFAAAVVQTPKNWGGAYVYYRLSDQTSTLTDVLDGYHGGWVGAHPLGESSVVDDPDASTFFNGTDTEARVGVLRAPNPETNSDLGLGPTGAVRENAERPVIQGQAAMIVFKTMPGSTKTNMYLFARADTAINVDVSVRVDNGNLIARFHGGNDWHELLATKKVNDGQWHMALISTGKPLDEPNTQDVLRLYLDGTLQGQVNGSTNQWTRALTIGNLNAGNPGGRFEGYLDEHAHFDYAPSRFEVTELWNQLKKLSGPPLRIEPPLVETTVKAPAPTIRKSSVRPLNEFYDDFEFQFLDRSKWRDASPTARVIDGDLVLRANGEQALTQDYFQAKDSSLIWRIDKLPLREGEIFLGLTNEHDIIPDVAYGGTNEFDSFRRHRDIGFKITRYQHSGRTVTELYFQAYGQSFTGPTIRERSIPYVPDDPNYPSPHRWLRLDIDGGASGGATWYTSADGVNWTDQYDVHGGKVNAVITQERDENGQFYDKTTFIYEDADEFRLFDRDERFPAETDWRGYMRVLARVQGGSEFTDLRVESVNVLPVGTGTPVDILAKPTRVQTSSSNEYLLYAMNPRIYSSARDVSVEAIPARVSARMPTPPEPVYVFAPAAEATVTLRDPQRAGDALPIQIAVATGYVAARMVTPKHGGQAQPVFIDVPSPTAYFLAHPAEVSTDRSSPAPSPADQRRTITIKTRRVNVYVTQN